MTRSTWAATLCALVLVSAKVVLATPTEETSLNTCQAQVKSAAKTYVDGYVNAVANCLQAVSSQIVQKNAANAAAAARTCVSQFRAISDSRKAGKSLVEKLTASIAMKCQPGMLNVTHTLGDILGSGAGVPESIEVENIEKWCTNFGGSGSITTLQQWIDCVAASHACGAQQTIATQYPRAVEWLNDVGPLMALLSPSSIGDTSQITDAVAGLNAVVAAMDPGNTGQANFQCGGNTGQPASQPLKTGQTTDYGPGSDGNLLKGDTRQFTDNGDGTITDNKTGLVWEKKDQSGGIHDFTNMYTWGMTSSPYTMNGTMVTTFLATLNAGGGFVGHTDWRIPNQTELLSLVNYQNLGPAVHTAFNTSCAASCTVLTCSCTQSDAHWSSTTYQLNPAIAWFVDFYDGGAGFVNYYNKSFTYYVRAVRGGS